MEKRGMARKPGKTGRRVEVLVLDFAGERLPGATVILKPLGRREDGGRELGYVERWRSYQADDVMPGRYRLRVSAEGLQPDEREVEVSRGDVRETFVLGKEGMPFYYRGRVRVPFDPPAHLVAVSVKPGMDEKEEESLREYARRFKLEPEEVGEPVLQDNVRVFRFPAGTGEDEKVKIQEELAKNPLVRYAGAVLRLDKESVSFLTNELVVRFKGHVTVDQVPEIAGKHGLGVLRTIPCAGNAYLLKREGPASYAILKLCQAMVETGLVEYAEPNLITTMPDVQVNPTDFLYGQQWHLPLIGAPDAWAALQAIDPNLTFGHQDVIIAVMDRGIQSQTAGGVTQASHADFDGTVTGGADKVYAFYDFPHMVADNDAPPNEHGMGCAGVAGALAENPAVVAGETEGVAGIAPNCRLMGLIRPAGLPEIRYSDAYVWTAGFDPGWVAANYPAGTVFPPVISPGADIITNSFKGGAGAPISGLMADTFDFLATYGRGGRGVVLFFASGNDNADFALECPWAAYEKTIAVAASTDGETRAWYSNYGHAIDICAPSSGGTAGITTCDLVGAGNLAGHTGGGMDYRDDFGGTSSAAPLAAGLGGLILSVDRDFTWIEVRQILRDTAVQIDAANTDPIGQWVDTDGDGIPDYSQWYGHGRIDAHAAVDAAIAYPFNRDILVRDNLADTGAVPCAGAFWGSPDVWVRTVDPAIDGAAALPATYNDPPPHVSPVSGQDNWVYVRCRNIGTADSLDFYLRVYITHFPGFEFIYPDDFIPSNPPGQPVPTPMTPGTYLIGEVHHAPLAAGAVDIVPVTWPQALVPPEEVMVGGTPVKWHPCLLVEISPHDGPAATGVHVWDSNNLIQRNISIVYPDTDDTFAVAGVVGNRANHVAKLDLVVDRGNLPVQVKLYAEVVNPRAREELRRIAARRKPEVGESRCRVTLLDESRFLVDCSAVPCGGRMVVTLPANAKLELWPAGKAPGEGEYNFTLGSYRGREVAWLAEAGKTRLPVAAGPGELTPVIIGGAVGEGTRPGTYVIALSQVNPDGKMSGMMGIELHIKG